MDNEQYLRHTPEGFFSIKDDLLRYAGWASPEDEQGYVQTLPASWPRRASSDPYIASLGSPA